MCSGTAQQQYEATGTCHTLILKSSEDLLTLRASSYGCDNVEPITSISVCSFVSARQIDRRTVFSVGNGLDFVIS